MEAQRHIPSRFSLNISSLYLPSQSFVFDVLFTAVATAFGCVTKARLKAYVHLIQTVHSALLRHMLFGILVRPCSLVGSEPWHQPSSSPYFLTYIGIFKILQKKSKSFRQPSSSDCSLADASCRLFFLK